MIHVMIKSQGVSNFSSGSDAFGINLWLNDEISYEISFFIKNFIL